MLFFGPFELDDRTWTLARSGQPLDLERKLVALLAHLADQPGELVARDDLVDRFWPGAEASAGALTRGITEIRKALGDSASEPQFVQTVPRRGYRFIAEMRRAARPGPASTPAPAPAETDLRFDAWVRGEIPLEALDPAHLPIAIARFERAVAERPSYAPAYAGLANAHLVQYETTRFSNLPDRDVLDRGITAARRSCAVDPSLAEGWATLGYLLAASGHHEEARTAARRATALEPADWRHLFRLAYAAWGDERLDAVDRVITWMPGFAPARMLSAMVHVARGALLRAEREAGLGLESPAGAPRPIPAAGLHWLRGLILSARGEAQAALECFDQEIAAGTGTRVYGTEFTVSARVAAGFTLLMLGDAAAADARFRLALQEAPGDARAALGRHAAALRLDDPREAAGLAPASREAIAQLERGDQRAEAALALAGERIVLGRVGEAVEILDRLLTMAPPGPAGWMIAVDPMLSDVRYSAGRSMLLAKLAARAR